MHGNHEFGRFHRPRITGMSLDHVTLTLAGTFVIPTEGPTVWVINGGAGDRVVRLPALLYEKQIVIGNVGTTNNLSITDANGNALIDIVPQAIGIFFAGANRWIWFTGSFFSQIITTTLLTGSGTVAATDINVQVDGAGAVVLTLPLATTWDAESGWRGLPLEIADVSGNAAANNITINPSGADTIGGNASLTINSDFGSWQLKPRADGGGWTFR